MKLNELFFIESDNIAETQLWEMARVRQKNSGINVEIAVWDKKNANGAHWARIKVSNITSTFDGNDNFSVAISKSPWICAGKCKLKTSVLNDIFDWVAINYDTLMKVWNDEYEDFGDFYAELRPI